MRTAGLVGMVLGAAIVVVLPFAVMRAATAEEARDLAGWWISIDRLFPQMYEAGFVVPMEELLVVDGAGRAESRLMMFPTPTPPHVATKRCSAAMRRSARAPASSWRATS
jgi:hypothetical protein